ncbi:MAG: tRNA (adenosine(37)-N6)-threonylcarbamoyltransferase complex transferase subunit TsaD [Candidatus Pacebacteria bacterium]|nr:tRNA (adenosine(37)-N6)-threonylcarbamoyltransferase complex transferase subunit TsaD [Candidatus Paceibacterota bacterium]
MKILGIETSCDETAICILEGDPSENDLGVRLLGETINSQTKIHEQYGGVFPMMAKREHAKNILPLLEQTLKQASLYVAAHEKVDSLDKEIGKKLEEIFQKETGLLEETLNFISSIKKPDLDAIAVTEGPGLEPALWVGLLVAQALGLAWNIPVLPTNHMEGHIVASLLIPDQKLTLTLAVPNFPALALLISGGHTELVLVKDWHHYEIIGSTKDDAIGEAFDKVARLLGLPYPGGPEISKLAAEWRAEYSQPLFTLPRPMLKSPDFDFSFSGIKTAVLYAVRHFEKENNRPLNQKEKQALAGEFENAVTEVLISKTRRAIAEKGAQSLILGGGVTANTYIREAFKKLSAEMSTPLYLPETKLSTDNAVMIALAGYLRIKNNQNTVGPSLRAKGNLSL